MKLSGRRDRRRCEVILSAPPGVIREECRRLENLARPSCSCSRPAKFLATVHPLDRCHLGAPYALLCIDCIQELANRMSARLESWRARLPAGARVACVTCQRPIANLRDVLEVEML